MFAFQFHEKPDRKHRKRRSNEKDFVEEADVTANAIRGKSGDNAAVNEHGIAMTASAKGDTNGGIFDTKAGVSEGGVHGDANNSS